MNEAEQVEMLTALVKEMRRADRSEAYITEQMRQKLCKTNSENAKLRKQLNSAMSICKRYEVLSDELTRVQNEYQNRAKEAQLNINYWHGRTLLWRSSFFLLLITVAVITYIFWGSILFTWNM